MTSSVCSSRECCSPCSFNFRISALFAFFFSLFFSSFFFFFSSFASGASIGLNSNSWLALADGFSIALISTGLPLSFWKIATLKRDLICGSSATSQGETLSRTISTLPSTFLVVKSVDLAHGSAPAFNNSLTLSKQPSRAAKCKGVQPMSFLLFTLTPGRDSKNFKHSIPLYPFLLFTFLALTNEHTMDMGSMPSSFSRVYTPFLATSHLTEFIAPTAHATCNGEPPL